MYVKIYKLKSKVILLQIGLLLLKSTFILITVSFPKSSFPKTRFPDNFFSDNIIPD